MSDGAEKPAIQIKPERRSLYRRFLFSSFNRRGVKDQHSLLVHNERLKVRASFWNSLGIASMIAAGLVPTVPVAVATANVDWWLKLLFSMTALIFGLGFRGVAAWILGGLKEQPEWDEE